MKSNGRFSLNTLSCVVYSINLWNYNALSNACAREIYCLERTPTKL